MTTIGYNRLTVIRHTDNHDAMLAFYRDGLGMTVTESWDQPGDRGAILAPAGLSGVEFEVLDMAGVTTAGARPTNVNVNLFVADARATLEALQERGVTIARGLEDAPWGYRSFGVDDPGGLRIWFQQRLR